MATVAIDATYSVGPEPSGVAVFSRRLLESFADLNTPHRFLVCYRLSRLKHRGEFLRRPGRRDSSGRPQFGVRLFQEPFTFWLPFESGLFHSLGQRPAPFRFRHEIVTIYDIFPITSRAYSAPEFQRKFSRLLHEAVRRSERILTLSQYTAGQLSKHCAIGNRPIHVIVPGVDVPPQSLAPSERVERRKELVGPGSRMVLVVGVIQTRKNTLNAVRALEHLPGEYKLVLSGGDGHGAQTVHDYIRRSGLGSRVRVLGYTPAETMPALYQAADVFLFPSLEEGFGLPVLEAMSFGTPVVASSTSCLPEVGGDAALYVNPQDPVEIAAKVQEAAETEVLREEMVQRGLRRAREFTWQRAAEEHLKVYDEVLEQVS